MGPEQVPRSRDEITRSWMRDALGRKGQRAPKLRELHLDDLGDGASALGEVLRCRLRWEDPGRGLPQSVIVKMHSQDARIRRFSKAMRLNRREYYFYRHVAPAAVIRSPRLLFGGYDAKRDDVVLLLEDLQSMAFADVLEGATPEQAASSLKAIAGLHGRYWNRRREPPLSECESLSTRIRVLAQAGYVKALPGALKRFGAFIPPAARRMAEAIAAKGLEYTRDATSGPVSFMHGDYHVNNVFFDGEGKAVVLDWQTSGRGNPLLDVGLFLSRSVSIEVRRQVEREGLELYWETLREAGASDISLEECWRQYRMSLLFSLMVMVLAAGQLGSSERLPTDDLGVIFRRVATAAEDLDAEEFIPDRLPFFGAASMRSALFGFGYRLFKSIHR